MKKRLSVTCLGGAWLLGGDKEKEGVNKGES